MVIDIDDAFDAALKADAEYQKEIDFKAAGCTYKLRPIDTAIRARAGQAKELEAISDCANALCQDAAYRALPLMIRSLALRAACEAWNIAINRNFDAIAKSIAAKVENEEPATQEK